MVVEKLVERIITEGTSQTVEEDLQSQDRKHYHQSDSPVHSIHRGGSPAEDMEGTVQNHH